MNLSDQLVELLATRDELVMLREASDDFVILLNLVHQRRARASRAALLMTARTRVRPKMNLFRIYLPWTNRGVGLFSAVSSSSVFDSTGGLRSSTTSYHQVPSAKGGSGTLPHRYTDAVALNVATGSAAYYKALNLQSKQRRPRGAQLHMSSGNASANLCGVAHHPVGKTHPTDDSYPNGDVVKDVPLFSLEQINLSSPQAQQRLNALRQQCASLPWPNGQPQESQSLNLCLPYRLDSAHGITLATLRIINQILYGTLLENPATEKFIKTYLNSLSEQVKVSTWIDRNHKWQINGHTDTGHVADPIESVPEPLIQMA
ncbi:hypothetical protein D915_008837 [Fasciola hepatica]|uniref:Uncharacterized protein n=1 Tax=Fasciola hepatica TaxID=6192 RepID=A0A4E0RTV2_FASHE|nr:hypothetical protein D915_008837 [Fasciola hepatica]